MKTKWKLLVLAAIGVCALANGNYLSAATLNSSWDETIIEDNDMHVDGKDNPEVNGLKLSYNTDLKAYLLDSSGKRLGLVEDATILKPADKIEFVFKLSGEWFGTGRDIDSPPPYFLPAVNGKPDYSKLYSDQYCTAASQVNNGEKNYLVPMIIKYPTLGVNAPNLSCDSQIDSAGVMGSYEGKVICTVKDSPDESKSLINQTIRYPGQDDFAHSICKYRYWEQAGDFSMVPYYRCDGKCWKATDTDECSQWCSYEGGDYCCGYKQSYSLVDCSPSTKNCVQGELSTHSKTYNVKFSSKMSLDPVCNCLNHPQENVSFVWENPLAGIKSFEIYRKKSTETKYTKIATINKNKYVSYKKSSGEYSYLYQDAGYTGTDKQTAYIIKVRDNNNKLTNISPAITGILANCGDTVLLNVTPTEVLVTNTKNLELLTFKNSNPTPEGWLNKVDLSVRYVNTATNTISQWETIATGRSVDNTPDQPQKHIPKLHIGNQIQYRGIFSGDKWADPNCSASISKTKTVTLKQLGPKVTITSACSGSGAGATGINVNVGFQNNTGVKRHIILKSKDFFQVAWPKDYNKCMNFVPSVSAWIDPADPGYETIRTCYDVVVDKKSAPTASWAKFFKFGTDLPDRCGYYSFFAAACMGDTNCSSAFQSSDIPKPNPITCSPDGAVMDLKVNGQDSSLNVQKDKEFNIKWQPTACAEQLANCNSSSKLLSDPTVNCLWSGSKPLSGDEKASCAQTGVHRIRIACGKKLGAGSASDFVDVDSKEVECGSSHERAFFTKPSTGLCSDGSSVTVTADDAAEKWKWSCVAGVDCWAHKLEVGCGSADGQSFVDPPTEGLCNDGSTPAGGLVENTFYWAWKCGTKDCKAAKKKQYQEVL